MAIPAFAATEFQELTITYEDLFNMFVNGDLSVSFHMSNTSTYNLSVTTSVGTSESIIKNETYPLSSASLLDDSIFFSLPWISIATTLTNGVKYDFDYSINFPFPYKLNNTTFYIRTFFPYSVSTSNLLVFLLDSQGETVANFGDSANTLVSVPWSNYNSDPFASYYYDLFYHDSGSNNYITGLFIPQNYNLVSSYFSVSGSSNKVGSSISFQVTNTFTCNPTQPNNTASPIGISLSSFSVLIPVEVVPDVEEYLDIIAGPPTAENQAKITELKEKFDSIDDDLNQAADDMAVEVPDISDVQNDIPDELQQGNDLVSETVLTPILNVPFIGSIFTGLFSILALKLILFGSGSS